MGRFFIALIAAVLTATGAQAKQPEASVAGTWSAEANGPGRFVAAHGQRSSIMGYPETGLEVWAYPLQLLSGYQLRFREAGRVEPFEGRALLSRIETSASEVVRIYIGPDFVVREHLFVPMNIPAVILTYEVEGRPDVEIEARFQPSLNLMWPGAIGGQETAWNNARGGYVEREPVHGFSAVIRSPETIVHDSTINAATNRPSALGLVMAPRRETDGVRRARLVISQEQPGAAGDTATATATSLGNRSRELLEQENAHYASVLDEAVEITTPDPDVNRALASSILAIEQAWVCAPDIGCGTVAGYGPSRPGRRPQYAWFFAGDGLVSVESLLAAGRYERARDELLFIAKYQNKSNGMIWHEMSTSAPLIEWEKRYPYMYVHVDITLQYLATVSDYVETTGDTTFLKAHWASIDSAWRYARSLIDPKTALPTIPSGKEGQNEQTVLHDDVGLSAAWIDAAKAFARLAQVHGDARLARQADTASNAAVRSVRGSYWDEANGFWFAGHKTSGEPFQEQRPDAANILLDGAFTYAEVDRALDHLATPDFQTDWGVRSLGSHNPDYDPNAYASGAVWGLGSSNLATILWKEHRPFTAWNAWHGMVSWASLDSPGHMHEVLAGDLFHPELESVPEQTWSSAGFLNAAVHGLLGLEVHGGTGFLTFAPHLPANWSEVDIKRLRVGSSRLDFHLTENERSISLEINNPGPAVTIDFDPQIPLGARLRRAEINGSDAPFAAMQTQQDQHARLRVIAGRGVTRAVVHYSGGIRIAPVEIAPRTGDKSVNLKLISAKWLPPDTLILNASVFDRAHAAIDLLTPMRLDAVQGADVSQLGEGQYRLRLRMPNSSQSSLAGYVPVTVTVKVKEP